MTKESKFLLIFIDADGNESVRYESPIIQFKDEASEDALKKLQDAYEGKIQTMINNIPKPQAPGPNATEIEKEEYLNERLQYGINAGLTKAVMEINSPRQELINSLMNDSHTKKEPVTVEPLPLIRRNDR